MGVAYFGADSRPGVNKNNATLSVFAVVAKRILSLFFVVTFARPQVAIYKAGSRQIAIRHRLLSEPPALVSVPCVISHLLLSRRGKLHRSHLSARHKTHHED